jgi:SAM-dependent methyltransferase
MTDLSADEYIRARLQPRIGDVFYLHLSDLLIGMKELIPSEPVRVLDYGCGGSPYRTLFNGPAYHRADLAGAAVDLDFEFSTDSLLSTSPSDYDCVLSSQVLEHVASPASYLAECRRVLKPGGCLILSTHGVFEDHACPYDYWRWTAHGLRVLVEEAGFNVEHIKKLTTGPRAVVFLAEREQSRMRFDRINLWNSVSFYGWMMDCGARLFRKIGSYRIHRACDLNLGDYRVVDADQSGHEIYIAILLKAHPA